MKTLIFAGFLISQSPCIGLVECQKQMIHGPAPSSRDRYVSYHDYKTRKMEQFRDKNLLGVVLNRVDSADTYNNYYYGYGADSVGSTAGK